MYTHDHTHDNSNNNNADNHDICYYYYCHSYHKSCLPASQARGGAAQAAGTVPTVKVGGLTVFRGNHLSNAACMTQVFFKSYKSCSKLTYCRCTTRVMP